MKSTPPGPAGPNPPPRSDPNNMQSVENTIMIANLNSIARVDQSLNTLMKIVALGGATPQQIMRFQGYIQRAREMGPQPHHAHLLNMRQPPTTQVQRPRPLTKPPAPVKPPAPKKLPKEKKPPAPKKPIIPKELKLTAFQEKYLVGATILFEFVENPNVRYALPQSAISEVISEIKPPVNEEDEQPVDILQSFLWIHNFEEYEKYEAKYAEYEKAIKQKEEAEAKKLKEEEDAKKKLEDEKEEARKKKEKEDEDKKKNESSEVEATEKVEGSESKEAENLGASEIIEAKEEKIVTKEDDASLSTVTDKENIEVKEEEKEDTKTNLRARRGRRPPPPPRKSKVKPEKKLVPPDEIDIRFTAMSYTLCGIPSRFIPILVNSSKPIEQVQKKMTNILSKGSRMPNYYLWYQVDGKLDEKLAEELRVELNVEEKKMNGVTYTSSSTAVELSDKKRKLKEEREEKTRQRKLKKLEEKKEKELSNTPPPTSQGDITHSEGKSTPVSTSEFSTPVPGSANNTKTASSEHPDEPQTKRIKLEPNTELVPESKKEGSKDMSENNETGVKSENSEITEKIEVKSVGESKKNDAETAEIPEVADGDEA